MLLQRSLLFFAMILLSCGASFSQEKFTHHHKMTSEYVERDDMSFEPSYFFVEQSLDSLDFEVQVTGFRNKKGDVVGISFWVDAENHADVIIQEGWVNIVYTINGKVIPRQSVYLGIPSVKKVPIHIKRIDNDIALYCFDKEERASLIGLRYLYHGEYPTEKVASIMFYASHLKKQTPFTVNFDY